jgi:hypothetical protein
MKSRLLQSFAVGLALIGLPVSALAAETSGAGQADESRIAREETGRAAGTVVDRSGAPSQAQAAERAGRSPGAADATYAARERSARNLDQFKGGEVSVYIGGGTLAVVLLVVLLVILL